MVDDDADIRRMAGLSLERLGGFRVTLAASGDEAVAAAAADRPDLVLLDVMMPGADGPATLSALQALPGCAALPVVFFTAMSNAAEVARLRGLGAIGVVAKPFEISELPKRIRAIAAEAGLTLD